MHVAWTATFRVPAGEPQPTLPRLRPSRRAPRARPALPLPAGVGAAGDRAVLGGGPDFDVANHVLPLGTLGLELDDQRFELLCDSVLSALARSQLPLWEIRLAPRFVDGRCGIVAKIHHALVDGRSAVEVAQLLFDVDRTGLGYRCRGRRRPRRERRDWRRGPSRWGPRNPARGARRRSMAEAACRRVATRGNVEAGGAGRRRVLRPAPASALNARIGPRRTLVRLGGARRRAPGQARRGCHRQRRLPRLAAGALRELMGPQPLKAMVPVNVRGGGEEGLARQPHLVRLRGPAAGRGERARSMARIRRDGRVQARRPAGRHAGGARRTRPVARPAAQPGGAGGREPAPVQPDDLEHPGPDFPLYMLGAELVEAHSRADRAGARSRSASSATAADCASASTPTLKLPGGRGCRRLRLCTPRASLPPGAEEEGPVASRPALSSPSRRN